MSVPEETQASLPDPNVSAPLQREDSQPCQEVPSPVRPPEATEHLSLHVDSQEMSSQGVDSTLAMMMDLGSRETGDVGSQEAAHAEPAEAEEAADAEAEEEEVEAAGSSAVPEKEMARGEGVAGQEDASPRVDAEREDHVDQELNSEPGTGSTLQPEDSRSPALRPQPPESRASPHQRGGDASMDDSFTEYLRRGHKERVFEEEMPGSDDVGSEQVSSSQAPDAQRSPAEPAPFRQASQHESSQATERVATPPRPHGAHVGGAVEGVQSDKACPMDPHPVLQKALGILVRVIYNECHPGRLSEVPQTMANCDNGAEVWMLTEVIEKIFARADIAGQAAVYKEMVRELEACLPHFCRPERSLWPQASLELDSSQELAQAFKHNFLRLLEPCLAAPGKEGALAIKRPAAAAGSQASSSSSSVAVVEDAYESERKQAPINQLAWCRKYAGVVKRQRLASLGQDCSAGSPAESVTQRAGGLHLTSGASDAPAAAGEQSREALEVRAPAPQKHKSVHEFLAGFL
mmetsp:Transcript_156978/g.273309  ORF Transcript_156978/g.273309 Transcript_156978/m.273309 type:complete len:519 (-) Transcript_156978:166-1722(-)